MIRTNRRAFLHGSAALAAATALPRLALAADPIKVAAIYTVPIEQQWVSRIHKAATAAKERGEADRQTNPEDPDVDDTLEGEQARDDQKRVAGEEESEQQPRLGEDDEAHAQQREGTEARDEILRIEPGDEGGRQQVELQSSRAFLTGY